MVRTISATEAKVNFGAVTQQVIDDGEPVVVENHGQPRVAIVPVQQLDRLAELEEQERRRAWLERARALRSSVLEKNADLTSEQAEQIADEIVRDAADAIYEQTTSGTAIQQ
jgi:prevent-host-death family protein